MTTLTFLVLFTLCFLQGAAQFNGEKEDSYHLLKLGVESPLAWFKNTEPSFGHQRINQNKLPLVPSLTWAYQSNGRWGCHFGIAFWRLKYDVDYNFIAQPDPLIPSYSRFQNNYLDFRGMVNFAFIRTKKIDIYASAGFDVIALLSYSEMTTYSNGDSRYGELRDKFEGTIAAANIGVGGRFHFKQRFVPSIQINGRFLPVPLENAEYTRMNRLSFSGQIGLGYRL
jgi:hypothetical protein